MEGENKTAELNAGQTTQSQCPPGQTLSGQPLCQMPASGQAPTRQQPVQYQMPASGQMYPGQQPVQYQMPASGQAPPGQQPVQNQMPPSGRARPRRAERWFTLTPSTRGQQQSGFSLTMDFGFLKSRVALALCIKIVSAH